MKALIKLRCPHMPEDTFSHGAGRFIWQVNTFLLQWNPYEKGNKIFQFRALSLLKEMTTFSKKKEATRIFILKLICPLLKRGSILGSKIFSYGVASFQKGFCVQEDTQKVTKVIALVQNLSSQIGSCTEI